MRSLLRWFKPRLARAPVYVFGGPKANKSHPKEFRSRTIKSLLLKDLLPGLLWSLRSQKPKMSKWSLWDCWLPSSTVVLSLESRGPTTRRVLLPLGSQWVAARPLSSLAVNGMLHSTRMVTSCCVTLKPHKPLLINSSPCPGSRRCSRLKDQKKVGWLSCAKQPAEEYFRQCLTQPQKRRTPLVLRQGGGSDLDLVDVSQSELVADHVRSWNFFGTPKSWTESDVKDFLHNNGWSNVDVINKVRKGPQFIWIFKAKAANPQEGQSNFWTYQNDDGTCHLTVASPRPRTRKPVPTERLVTPKKRWVDTQPPGHMAPTQIDSSQSPTPTPTEAKERSPRRKTEAEEKGKSEVKNIDPQKAFCAQYAKWNFVNLGGSGDCAFRCCAHGIGRQQKKVLTAGDSLIREASRLRVLATGQLTKFRSKYEGFWAADPDEPAHLRANQELLRIDLRRQLLCLLGSLNGTVGRDLWFPVTSNQMVKLLFKRKGLLPSSWCNLTTATCPCVRKGTRIVSRGLGSRKLRSNPGNSTELEKMELVAAALKLPVAAASNWVWRLCCPYLMMSPQRHPGLQAQLLALAQVKLNLKREDRLRCCPWPSLQVMLRLVGSHATKTLLLFCPYPLVLNWVRRLGQIRHRLGLWQVSLRGALANPPRFRTTTGCGAHVCPHQWFGSPCGAYECLDVPFSFFCLFGGTSTLGTETWDGSC